MFQSASFERKQELGLAIEAAMDEAIDQGVALITPSPPSSSFVAAAQEALAKLNDKAAILTVPIMHRDKPVGAVVLERFSGEMFSPVRSSTLRCAVRRERPDPGRQGGARLGRAPDRSSSRAAVRGQVHRHRPSAVIKVGGAPVLAVALFLIFASDHVPASTPMRRSRAKSGGSSTRRSTATSARSMRAPASVVREGGLLAELQDNDLALDRLRRDRATAAVQARARPRAEPPRSRGERYRALPGRAEGRRDRAVGVDAGARAAARAVRQRGGGRRSRARRSDARCSARRRAVRACPARQV